jgi:nitrate reductase NapE component
MPIENENKSGKAGRWLTYLLIAMGVSFLCAVGLVSYDCSTPTETCMISKGFFPVYWFVLFIPVWPLVSVFGQPTRILVKKLKKKMRGETRKSE